MSERADTLDPTPLDEFVSTFASDRHCPTVSWGIVLDGRLTASGAIGDVTDHTVYRIASMTKSFSAAATLMLRDRGVLRLDDPIAEHAPELAALDRIDSPAITIRDLLQMTSGLPTDDPWADRHLDLTDADFDRIIDGGLLFAHPTGIAFEYSNFGYAVLGRVVHRAAGERIQDIITAELLEPLQMTATTWVRPEHDDWARPMRWLDDAFVDEREPLGDGLIAPMGGLWTTVADLARWVGWMDDAFPARNSTDDGPLRRSSRREMQAAQRYAGTMTIRGATAAVGYAYGLRIHDDPELGTVITHAGGFPGYGSNMRWVPDRRTGVIALANSTYAPMSELTERLLDLVAEQGLVPEAETHVSEHVDQAARRLVELLNDWEDGAAAELFTTSLVLDDSLRRRRDDAESVIADAGRISIRSIEATTAARATVRCDSDTGGSISVSFMLAPPLPPRIQSYEVTVESADAASG